MCQVMTRAVIYNLTSLPPPPHVIVNQSHLKYFLHKYSEYYSTVVPYGTYKHRNINILIPDPEYEKYFVILSFFTDRECYVSTRTEV